MKERIRKLNWFDFLNNLKEILMDLATDREDGPITLEELLIILENYYNKTEGIDIDDVKYLSERLETIFESLDNKLEREDIQFLVDELFPYQNFVEKFEANL